MPRERFKLFDTVVWQGEDGLVSKVNGRESTLILSFFGTIFTEDIPFSEVKRKVSSKPS